MLRRIRTHRLRWLFVAGALAAIAGSSALILVREPGPTAEQRAMHEAWDRWQAQGFDRYLVVGHCFATQNNQHTHILEVRRPMQKPFADAERVSVEEVRNGEVTGDPDIYIFRAGCPINITPELLFWKAGWDQDTEKSTAGEPHVSSPPYLCDDQGRCFCNRVNPPNEITYHPTAGYPTRVHETSAREEADWQKLDYWHAAWAQQRIPPRCPRHFYTGMSPGVPDYRTHRILEIRPIDETNEDVVYEYIEQLVEELTTAYEISPHHPRLPEKQRR
jgi:hypothetical protein